MDASKIEIVLKYKNSSEKTLTEMGHSVIEKPSWIGVKLEGQMCLLSFKNTFSSSNDFY